MAKSDDAIDVDLDDVCWKCGGSGGGIGPGLACPVCKGTGIFIQSQPDPEDDI